jgi:hypothetical protein
MNKTLLVSVMVVGLGAPSVGCVADEGTPPEISSLSYSPETTGVGQTATISGTIEFVDDDGDLELLGLTAIDPGGLQSDLPMSQIQGVAGTTEGTIGIQVFLVTSMVGTYQFEIFVVDAEGNESNRLAGTLEAQ